MSCSQTSWSRAAVIGAIAGVVGTAAMTATEKLEQRRTGRPDSYVPAHTLERLLGIEQRPDEERLVLNHAMHWVTGIMAGAVRGLMARGGLRGMRISLLVHLPLRLSMDQVLENATGVGAPPWTWPRSEQIIDTSHKAAYVAATGLLTDRLVSR